MIPASKSRKWPKAQVVAPLSWGRSEYHIKASAPPYDDGINQATAARLCDDVS